MLHDLKNKLTIGRFALAKKIDEGVEPIIEKLGTWLADKLFLAGEELTWVDFYGYEVLQLIDLIYNG